MEKPVVMCDSRKTLALLPIEELMDTLAEVALEYEDGRVCAPARQVVSFPDGALLLSMPATADDIGIHKLVNVTPLNRSRDLPTINGLMSVYCAKTGRLQLLMDAPSVTSRRTAAVSMLGLRQLCARGPRRVAVIGTGVQAAGHIQALATLYPDVPVDVVGRTFERAQQFVQQHKREWTCVSATRSVRPDVDVVIAVTTSKTPVYDQPPMDTRVIIAVGAYRHDMAEIGPRTLAGSQLYVDDPVGARHEAGDFLQACVEWPRVQSLASLLHKPARHGASVFKTVGCSAWDLAAARCALRVLRRS